MRIKRRMSFPLKMAKKRAPVTPRSKKSVFLATDTGGTFTDFVLLADGKLSTFKIPSTPRDPDKAIKAGLEVVGQPVDIFAHGTTVATNMVLERKGARTVLITTRGFRDVLEIGRQTRPSLYEPTTRPEPIVPRDMRLETEERLGPDGKALRPLTDDEVARVVKAVKVTGAEAVAVSFLFSFMDRSHEQKLGQALEKAGLVVSLSSEVIPTFREFERTSTTVIDAYIKPKMASYIGCIEALMPDTNILIMQSNGGVVRPSKIRKCPVSTLFSGPAGGMAAALHLSRRTGIKDLITFDMGGTSTDVSTVVDGRLLYRSQGDVEGFPIMMPMLDIISVGAGGGSLVKVDEAGGLKVGPESAGAEPGPVCYGRGGTVPAVTDCDLLAGIINPDNFLGGKMRLDTMASARAVTGLAKAAGMTVEELVKGAIDVVNSIMGRAVRVVTVQRGLDPADFALVAFGGAGPVHSAMLAKELGIKKVVVPFAAGNFSALGLMLADMRMDYSRTNVLDAGAEGTQAEVGKALADMEEATGLDLADQGVISSEAELTRALDMRYKGQSFELTVPYGGDMRRAVAAFHRAHEKTYTYSIKDRPVEVVNLRLSVVHRLAPPPPPKFDGKGDPRPYDQRRILLDGPSDADLHRWEDLRPGHKGKGPAVIEEKGFTTYVPKGFSWSMDRHGNIILARGGRP
jgi:N-methylhydantoinase A